MITNRYKIVLATSGKQDVKDIKEYLLKNFIYREIAEKFTKEMKKAMKELDTFPSGYDTTGFIYKGHHIYMKPSQTYLLFFTVDDFLTTVTILRVMQDGMNWKYSIDRWLRENQ